MYNISVLPDRRASDSLTAVEVWESLLTACGDPIDVAILQLARAGYTRAETATKTRLNVTTIYRRLKAIYNRYIETAWKTMKRPNRKKTVWAFSYAFLFFYRLYTLYMLLCSFPGKQSCNGRSDSIQTTGKPQRRDAGLKTRTAKQKSVFFSVFRFFFPFPFPLRISIHTRSASSKCRYAKIPP